MSITVMVTPKYFTYKNKYKEPSQKTLELRKRSEASKEAKAKIKEALEQGHKLCTKCNQELSLFNFDKDKKTYTGYSSWCKECKKTNDKRYRNTENIGDIDDKAFRE